MLSNLFQLNESPSMVRLSTAAELLVHLQLNDRLENAIYLPNDFQSPRPQNVIRKKTFENVSFKDTRFYKIVFRDCEFVDCLFVGAELERCEIHDCSFVGCNLSKVTIIDTYVDPQCFVGTITEKRYANIAVWLFQQLRANALNTHQPEHFRVADWEFRRWTRFELVDEYKRGKQTFRDIWFRVSANWSYQVLIGYGHSLRHFAMTSAILFIVVVSFNCWFWGFADKGMNMTPEVRSVSGLPRAIYYTVVTLTTVGYGDVTPITAGGMILAGIEAFLGLVWFGMLTSIIVKKVFR